MRTLEEVRGTYGGCIKIYSVSESVGIEEGPLSTTHPRHISPTPSDYVHKVTNFSCELFECFTRKYFT